MTIEDLRKNGWIVYEYIRGSKLYKVNLDDGQSDTDIGGVFICPPEMLLGLRSGYVEQVTDAKGDTVFYEFGRWMELLLKSNPNAIESLFVPEEYVIGEIHPIVQEVIKNRDLFLSKEIFKSTYGYAMAQIHRARGYNKLCNIPEDFQRKDILDFCYTFKGQGSQPIKQFLEDNGLNQKYCGLVNVPNMTGVYAVYYDLPAYFKFETLSNETKSKIKFDICNMTWDELVDKIEKREFQGYCGIANPDTDKSNDVRLSSVARDAKPICYMSYNKDAYTKHCKDYKEWSEWKKNRNPIRYESNRNYTYDSKNCMHCMRLIRMGKELAKGEGFNVVRTKDREYLLNIRKHKYEYEDIIAQLEKEKDEMEEAIKSCSLPENPDYEKINELLLKCRKSIYQQYD